MSLFLIVRETWEKHGASARRYASFPAYEQEERWNAFLLKGVGFWNWIKAFHHISFVGVPYISSLWGAVNWKRAQSQWRKECFATTPLLLALLCFHRLPCFKFCEKHIDRCEHLRRKDLIAYRKKRDDRVSLDRLVSTHSMDSKASHPFHFFLYFRK